MNLSYAEIREQMQEVAQLMWDRRLTNAAGGNFAVRVDDDRILLSPSMMSEHRHCKLAPKDFLLIDFEANILEGEGKLSREGHMHINIMKSFPNIGATIHAHPFYCMPFVSQAKPIPNLTEATMGRGCVGCAKWSKAYTDDLAANVCEYFEEHRSLAEKKPIGVIMPLHGVVVSGPNLTGAYSMLERIECDAFCALTAQAVENVQYNHTLGSVE